MSTKKILSSISPRLPGRCENKIRDIKDSLRYICLKLYLNQCRTEHNIAFFEWRKNFKEEAKELISKYSDKLRRKIEEEDKKVEDRQELENELLGFNLGQKDESIEELSVSLSTNVAKKSKIFVV